jgi:hypothetical protein
MEEMSTIPLLIIDDLGMRKPRPPQESHGDRTDLSSPSSSASGPAPQLGPDNRRGSVIA